jgi:hypothetical protein
MSDYLLTNNTVLCLKITIGHFVMKKYVRPQHDLTVEKPYIDWHRHRQRYQTQVIRQNCSNIEYMRVGQEGRRLKEFIDDSFRCDQSSFGARRNKNNCSQALSARSWKRLTYRSGDSIIKSEPIQGTFRTENLLSCFLALPIRCQLQLFEDQNFEGKTAFYVRLNKEGIWRYILVDNLVPYATDDICLLSRGFELTLLEKAWAKYEGTYDSLDMLEKTRISDIMSDLTGAPSEEYKCNHPKLLFIMNIMLKRNYVLLANNQGCPLKRKKIEEKLCVPPDYAYPIIRIEGEYIIIHNIWGA